jgi:hypothetical protein
VRVGAQKRELAASERHAAVGSRRGGRRGPRAHCTRSARNIVCHVDRESGRRGLAPRSRSQLRIGFVAPRKRSSGGIEVHQVLAQEAMKVVERSRGEGGRAVTVARRLRQRRRQPRLVGGGSLET